MSTAAAAITYEDMKPLVWKAAWANKKRHGGRLDDRLSDANLGFALAYDSYDPDRGMKFSTWFVNRARWVTLADVDSRIKVESRETSNHDDSALNAIHKRDRIAEIAEGLSDDAQTILDLVVGESIKDIKYLARCWGDGTPRNMRKALCEYLAVLGLGAQRIEELFEEIRRAL